MNPSRRFFSSLRGRPRAPQDLTEKTLLHAAHGGDDEAVAALLGQEPSLLNTRTQDWPHYTLLMVANRMGQLSITWLLLTRGVDVNARDAAGRSALWYAAEGGYDDCLHLLLQRGADPSCADGEGVTPLMVAAAKGHVAVINRLLRCGGVDVDARDKRGGTALYRGCEKGRIGATKALLRGGLADPSLLPYHLGGGRGRKTLVQVVRDQGHGRCLEALQSYQQWWEEAFGHSHALYKARCVSHAQLMRQLYSSSMTAAGPHFLTARLEAGKPLPSLSLVSMEEEDAGLVTDPQLPSGEQQQQQSLRLRGLSGRMALWKAWGSEGRAAEASSKAGGDSSSSSSEGKVERWRRAAEEKERADTVAFLVNDLPPEVLWELVTFMRGARTE